jgi:hypothetical protein
MRVLRQRLKVRKRELKQKLEENGRVPKPSIEANGKEMRPGAKTCAEMPTARSERKVSTRHIATIGTIIWSQLIATKG